MHGKRPENFPGRGRHGPPRKSWLRVTCSPPLLRSLGVDRHHHTPVRRRAAVAEKGWGEPKTVSAGEITQS